MKSKIFLLEDETNLRKLLALNLKLEGYEVRTAINGENAISLFKEERFDLCILDIMVPLIDGISVCEHIRLRNDDVPILFLSAKNTGEDRIRGLKAGADDYLSKPFELEELLLKVKRLISKGNKASMIAQGQVDGLVRFGNNSINFNTFEAKNSIRTFTLTTKEAQLMKFFFENKGKVMSREKLLYGVWGYTTYPATRTIDNFILNLRKYFEEDMQNPQYFRSQRGTGYIFTPDPHRIEVPLIADTL